MPEISLTYSSTRCLPASRITCAASRRRSASSTPRPVPACTISAVRKRAAWHAGIERVLAAPLEPPVTVLLAPYLEVVGALNERGRLKNYPRPPPLGPAP